jgi:formate dehydrogenase assembly factor FdhD
VKNGALAENEIIVYEEKLAYAINCPVTVANTDADGARNGIVVYLERGKGSDGKPQVTYAIQFEEGDCITIESGVDAKRIKYRAQDCGVGGKGERISNPVTDEEEKGKEDISHTSSAKSPAQMDSNDIEGSLSHVESSNHIVADNRGLHAAQMTQPSARKRKSTEDEERNKKICSAFGCKKNLCFSLVRR